MGIIYFDICAIPLFAIILFVCFHRKMVKGNANRLFLLVVLISFFCTLADLGMEVTDNAAPLTPAGVVLCNASTYIYFILRNANMPILLLYLLALTRTTFLIRKKRMQFLFACPYVCLVLILVQNPFTHNVFTVTANDGYNRGPLLLIFYGIALLYGIVGLSYCIYCKRYLTFEKWGALLSLYLLAHIAVMIQFFYPDLLLEMFFTAVSELLILISIMRPEERMDQEVGTGRFHSAEALARIMDPEYGMISPAVFIPAAEAQGFIIPFGDIVLDQVFRFISQLDREELGLSYIEINLSVAQCMEKSLPDKIRTLQQKYNVDPSKVNLEITETTFENINEIMVENVDKLIKMGYSFSLDDYGTGYSNIQRVNHIPIKIVKIDKSMIDETVTGNGKIILEHTVRMMKSIGKELVAEGVESKSDATMLKELCCDYIQGFYYSRPLSATEFVSFLRQQNKFQS